MRKAQVFATLLLTVVLIICMASPAFAADEEIVTAYYRDKVYHGTIRQCQEQAWYDFAIVDGKSIYAVCDYEYLRKTQKLYNLNLNDETWQYNYDAFGIDIPGLTPAPSSSTPTPTQTTSSPDPTPSSSSTTQQPSTRPTATPTTTTVKPTASPTAKPIAPAAPGSMKAVSASYNSIKVSWSAVSGAGGYEVWYSVGSGYYRMATVSGTSSTSSKLTTGRRYYFKVRAYRTVSGTRVYSSFTQAVSAIPVPATPLAPKAASTSYNSVKLAWKAVAGAGGYEVWRSASSTGIYQRVATVSGTSSISTKLTTGKRYYFRVRAYRTVSGKKVYGAFVSAVSAIPVPSSPAAPKAASASYNSIKLTWKAVTGAGGYEVWRSASSTGTYQRVATVAGTTSTSSKLTTGKRYYFKVRAYRTVSGKKVYGAFVPAFSAIAVPAVPTAPKATSASYNSVKLTWNAVAGATKYEIYRADTSKGQFKWVTETTSTTYTKGQLPTGKSCYFKVRAYRLMGKTKVYSNFTAVFAAKPVPTAPTSISAIKASSTSVKLVWNKVAGATKYEVYRATSNAGTYTKIGETTSTSYINTKLPAGKTFFYKVRAYRLVGKSKVYSPFSPVTS